MKKVLLSLAAAGTAIAMVPLFAAFEAHVINVTARIENALQVSTDALDFGTVFPQEQLDEQFGVRLSESFLSEDRVDDVEYFIRQKPKCGVTTNNGEVLIGPTATGHVIPGENGSYTIDCGPSPIDMPTGATWGLLPLLCPYLSKHPIASENDPSQNDDSLAAFHQPFTIVADPVGGPQVVWNDVAGYLSKIARDISDTWNIDLKVPCFGGYCAQDWADYVHGINSQADPDDYVQPIGNEHKVFGCDLWVEVSGVSESDD